MSKRIVCPPGLRDAALTIIAAKRVVDPATGCWSKIGKQTLEGYSYIHLCGMRGLWHRVCYAVHHGECAEGSLLDHTCHNRRCGNPEHLVPGTHADNMRSIVINGTHWTKSQKWLVPHGEAHSHAKFADAEVRSIWDRFDAGVTRRTIQDEYLVSESTVVWLAKRFSYRHLLTSEEVAKWPPRKPQRKVVRRAVGRAPMRPSDADCARFHRRIKTLPNGCQVLPKCHDPNANAAMCSVGGRNMVVARAAWVLKYGEIADGIVVRHTCHEGHNHCCNIEHLILGTRKDNSHDMTVAGRGGKTKLTAEDVVDVFRRYATGGFTLKELSAVFQITIATLSKALRRATHRHVVIDSQLLEAVCAVRKRRLHHCQDSTPITETSEIC